MHLGEHYAPLDRTVRDPGRVEDAARVTLDRYRVVHFTFFEAVIARCMAADLCIGCRTAEVVAIAKPCTRVLLALGAYAGVAALYSYFRRNAANAVRPGSIGAKLARACTADSNTDTSGLVRIEAGLNRFASKSRRADEAKQRDDRCSDGWNCKSHRRGFLYSTTSEKRHRIRHIWFGNDSALNIGQLKRDPSGLFYLNLVARGGLIGAADWTDE